MHQPKRDKIGRFAPSPVSPTPTLGKHAVQGRREPQPPSSDVPQLHKSYTETSRHVSADEPLWPSNRQWEATLTHINVPNECQAAVKRTYRAQFIRAWKRKFLASPDGPASTKEAWDWRDECEEQARHAVEGAHLMLARDVQRGMVVRTTHERGYAEQTVRGAIGASQPILAVPTGNGGWIMGRDAKDNPDAQLISYRHLQLANGHSMEFSDDRINVIRFPNLEA